MIQVWQVRPEQARLLNELHEAVQRSRAGLEAWKRAAEESEARFVLATEAIFAGVVPGGAVVSINVSACEVALDDAPTV